MPRFFTTAIQGDTATLTGEDAKHISKVLRMAPGEAITLCDCAGFDYRCTITQADGDQVTVQVAEKIPNRTESAVKLRLYQALPKGEKLDFIVQKAVELGASQVVPVLTSRCVSRPAPKSMAKKIIRLQKIALEAAKQSERGIIPEILPLHSFREAVSGMKSDSHAILLYERAEQPLRQVLQGGGDSVSLLVGSEGGFSPEEAEYAAAEGIAWASLGRRILRCETAPICALSAILYQFGEF